MKRSRVGPNESLEHWIEPNASPSPLILARKLRDFSTTIPSITLAILSSLYLSKFSTCAAKASTTLSFLIKQFHNI